MTFPWVCFVTDVELLLAMTNPTRVETGIYGPFANHINVVRL